MNKPINKTCPHCQQPFLARRKNQRYCTNECRIDANNAVFKGRYDRFIKEAPQLVALKQQVKKLIDHIDSLTVVIKVAPPVKDVLTYGGRRYKYQKKANTSDLKLNLYEGGALLVPGNKIIYRRDSITSGNYHQYELDE